VGIGHVRFTRPAHLTETITHQGWSGSDLPWPLSGVR
jgi:hypothetical protein